MNHRRLGIFSDCPAYNRISSDWQFRCAPLPAGYAEYQKPKGKQNMKNILYIVWSDNNELGIPIIDEQHRAIISTINSLHYFMQPGHGDDIIQPNRRPITVAYNINFKQIGYFQNLRF